MALELNSIADFVALFSRFEYPWVFWLIIPIFIVLRILLKKDFIKFADAKPRNKERRFVWLTRTLIFALILVAIASPFNLETTTIQGDPFVKIFVDNSTSFSLYDQKVAGELRNELENYVEVETVSFGDTDKTDLGDALLRGMERDESILLITDGNNNYGSALGDVGLYARRLNASLNVINLKPTKDDSSIKIIGPSKVTSDVENTYTVVVDGNARNVVVEIDGEQVYSDNVFGSVSISKTFSSGYHRLVARIVDKDYFSQNNVYYRTIKVVEKPKITLLTSEPSPMSVILDELYEANTIGSLPGYANSHALVVNDVAGEILDPQISGLGDYVSDGNGLLFIGGANSFDKGNYKGGLVETLLPVNVGAGVEEGEKINVVIAIDISKSTADLFGSDSATDVEKALALGALSNIGPNSNVGIVAFNTKSYTVSDISPLGPKRADVEKKIKSLIDIGNTYLPVGLAKSIEMLENVPGEKNIILISDGKSGGLQLTANYIKTAASKGIKTILISVENTPIKKHRPGVAHVAGYGAQFLYDAVVNSEVENALFFRGLESPQKINVLFGEKHGSKPQGSRFLVVTLNDNHFITDGIELDAAVTGFNQVIPKSSAQLLITTDTGEPLLTVWRYGLGRVAALSTDDGEKWAGELLNKKNSKLITRALNWIIGDPERKLDKFVDIPDTRINEGVEITVKGDNQPVAEGVAFFKVSDEAYKGTTEEGEEGFHTILGATYAVNYPREFEKVSFSSELTNVVQATGGEIFERKDIEKMVNTIRSQSRRTLDDKNYFRWPFVLAAMLVLLFEICVRRMAENKRWRRHY